MSVRVAVDPPLHVETFASHASVTWTAAELGRFLDAVGACESVPAETTPVVDATNAAGQQRLSLSEIDPGRATTYVRVEPPAPWTLAWERRTEPVVSLSGAPSTETCRRFHLATTDCQRWSADAVARLESLLDG
jgi:hypothetical protein